MSQTKQSAKYGMWTSSPKHGFMPLFLELDDWFSNHCCQQFAGRKPINDIISFVSRVVNHDSKFKTAFNDVLVNCRYSRKILKAPIPLQDIPLTPIPLTGLSQFFERVWSCEKKCKTFNKKNILLNRSQDQQFVTHFSESQIYLLLGFIKKN